MENGAKSLGLRSIRGKLVLIYVLLVLIAITVTGVFVLNQLEAYYVDTIRSNITSMVTGGTLIDTLDSYDDPAANREAVQGNVDTWSTTLQEEIFVVDDDFNIIASNNANADRSALEILDAGIIMTALSGESAESQSTISTQSGDLRVMNLAFPIGKTRTSGVLYIRADMSSVDDNVSSARDIFGQAMLIALLVTLILGIVISRSITGPINDVTEKARRMSEGDFNQEVSVKSDDEIGQLASMFNFLRLKLNDTLEEISSEKNKLETVLRYMADALIAVDLDGRIIHANDAARSMLRVSAEELENEPFDSLMAGLNKELTLETLRERCAEGQVSEVFDANGFTYDIRYDNYKNEAGENIGIIMIIQDITERQKLENMQMDFVANVSHELKTPLTTIKSYTETLMDGAVEDRDTANAFLGIIDTEADRMNRMVKELLQMSRIEHNQEQWHIKETNLILLVKTCVTKVSMTAQSKKQHLNCLFDEDGMLACDVDKDGIEQVVLNVLSNAIKYTQEGGRIDIDVYRRGMFGTIVVTDNGIGIPESMISRVFERFFRVDKARSREMGGTGLGLSISKQIVEEHNGTIELESREGKGTKVTVSLPLTIKRGQSGII